MTNNNLGCGKEVKMFYSNMEYIIECGHMNPISKNIILCPSCQMKADVLKIIEKELTYDCTRREESLLNVIKQKIMELK
jgi:hypothetical protein